MASGWMKRGIALLNENTKESLTASLHWFEGAIELRRSLPLQENALVSLRSRRRLDESRRRADAARLDGKSRGGGAFV